MSCHFVFTEAWLMNFNRWFLLAFTHPYWGLCFLYFSFYACFSLFPATLSRTRQTRLRYGFTSGSDCGKFQCEENVRAPNHGDNNVQQWKEISSHQFAAGKPRRATLNDFNADFNLWGIGSGWDWERALSYRQSAQIILSWAASQLTALAFWLNTFFQTCLVRLKWSEEILDSLRVKSERDTGYV